MPGWRLRRTRWSLALGRLVSSWAVVAIFSTPASAYSVIAHLEAVDAMWDAHMVALLERRFGQLPRERLQEARAYAYGGALIQDLGYYPFGSHLFTNLTHYVRTGDFVGAL